MVIELLLTCCKQIAWLETPGAGCFTVPSKCMLSVLKWFFLSRFAEVRQRLGGKMDAHCEWLGIRMRTVLSTSDDDESRHHTSSDSVKVR